MTPAINLAKKANIPFTVHEYQHDAVAGSCGRQLEIELAPADLLILTRGAVVPNW